MQTHLFLKVSKFPFTDMKVKVFYICLLSYVISIGLEKEKKKKKTCFSIPNVKLPLFSKYR